MKDSRPGTVHPFQCSHAGSIYGPGDTAKVPASIAEHWTIAGLAT